MRRSRRAPFPADFLFKGIQFRGKAGVKFLPLRPIPSPLSSSPRSCPQALPRPSENTRPPRSSLKAFFQPPRAFPGILGGSKSLFLLQTGRQVSTATGVVGGSGGSPKSGNAAVAQGGARPLEGLPLQGPTPRPVHHRTSVSPRAPAGPHPETAPKLARTPTANPRGTEGFLRHFWGPQEPSKCAS